MSSHDRTPDRRRVLAALSLGLVVSGCFTPLYSERTQSAAVGGASVRTALGQVEVKEVGGRVGLEVRNALIFELNGGAGNPVGAPFRLEMSVDRTMSSTIINPTTGRATVEVVTLDATFRLRDVADDKVVMLDKTFAKTTFERTAQLFARDRALREAETRVAKLIAEQVRARLASYFLTRV